MNWLKSKQAFPIVALFFILAMAFLYNLQPKQQVEGRQCQLVDGVCHLSFKNQAFSVQISPSPIQLEEELNVDISYPKDKILVSAWVEGVNMFMGRTKIILSERVENLQNQMSRGVMFLGSCSEPNMRWRLVTEFSDDQSAQPQHFYFNFTTNPPF